MGHVFTKQRRWCCVQYLYLASLEDLAAPDQEYQAKAVKITEPPTDQHWGMREMLVEDVDGHTLRIGGLRPHE